MEKVFLGVLANAVDPIVIRAVRGVLDFIYYAQFEVHTDETLTHLDAAWAMFHDNKHIFLDLGIREHFNISKIHNIKHYLDSIRELGSATGYNTEATERLHINFAKIGYRASNRKNYEKQMTVWLRRQEAIHRFRQYLQWVQPDSDYTKKVRNENFHARSVGGNEDEIDDVDDRHNDVTMRPQHQHDQTSSYRVSKKPSFPQLTIASISEDFGAVDFVNQLTSFLTNHPLHFANIPAVNWHQLTFPVYRRLHLMLPPVPEVSSVPIKDSVIATRFERGTITAQGIKRDVPARFSTVLVRHSDGEHAHHSSNNSDPLNGVGVAQVRLIFKLPEAYQGQIASNEPLLYVHWLTQALRKFEADLG
ncbi:hypothetical protein C0992_010258, partial [Termitomyces sp. T32_za158]